MVSYKYFALLLTTMETECIKDFTSAEQPKPKKTSITILEIEGVTVTKDSMSYLVSGGEIKNRVSYMNTFESAMREVSDRLFLGKLTLRAAAGRSDFRSLVELVEEYKAEMKEKFRL